MVSTVHVTWKFELRYLIMIINKSIFINKLHFVTLSEPSIPDIGLDGEADLGIDAELDGLTSENADGTQPAQTPATNDAAETEGATSARDEEGAGKKGKKGANFLLKYL